MVAQTIGASNLLKSHALIEAAMRPELNECPIMKRTTKNTYFGKYAQRKVQNVYIWGVIGMPHDLFVPKI